MWKLILILWAFPWYGAGDDELKDATVSVRKYGQDDSTAENAKMFVDSVVADISNFSRKDDTDKD